MANLKYDEDSCTFEDNIAVSAGIVATMAAAPKNAQRAYLMIQNNGTGKVYVTFGTQTPTSANGVIIGSGEAWEPRKVPNGQINVLAELASTPVVIAQGSIQEAGAA